MVFRLIEDYIFESKEDIQRFIDKFGQDAYDRLQKNKQRIRSTLKDPKYVDITWLVKNANSDELEEILNSSENKELDIEGKPIPKPTNTKELIYNDNGWKVYKVFDVEDMIDIGRDTGWCIAGKYGVPDTKVSQANQYFNQYKDRLGLECYYVLIHGNEKECVLMQGEDVNSVWNKQDREIDCDTYRNKMYDSGIPFSILGMEDWSNKVFVYDNTTKHVPQRVVSAKISGSVKDIPYAAFFERIYLKSVEIENGVELIGSDVFRECYRLKNVNIPNSVEYIGDDAFESCYKLKDVIIPSSVKHIGGAAFYECSSITDISIPDGISSIKFMTFNGCTSLKSISLPSSVKTIENFAFYMCDKLEDVYYSGTKEQFDAISIGLENECLLNTRIHFNS